jgi:hypothetical protein
MTRYSLWLAVVAILVGPSLALAQVREPRPAGVFGPVAGDLEVTFGASGVSDRKVKNTAFAVGGSLGYFLTDEFEIALRQNINVADIGETVVNAATRVALDYHFNLQRLRPFVGVNIGGVYGDGVRDTGAMGFEGGLKYFVHERTFLYGMAEYQWLFRSASGAGDNFRHGQFLYSLGIGFLF